METTSGHVFIVIKSNSFTSEYKSRQSAVELVALCIEFNTLTNLKVRGLLGLRTSAEVSRQKEQTDKLWDT